MTTSELRKELKKTIDRLPPERLASLADYVHFLERPSLEDRIRESERQISKGNGTPWREVRADA